MFCVHTFCFVIVYSFFVCLFFFSCPFLQLIFALAATQASRAYVRFLQAQDRSQRPRGGSRDGLIHFPLPFANRRTAPLAFRRIHRLRERMYVSYKHKIDPAPAAAPAPAPEPAEEKKPDKPAKEEKKAAKGEEKPKEGKEGGKKKKDSKKESAPPLSPEDGGTPGVYWTGYGPPPGQYAQTAPPPAAPLGPPPAAAPKTSRMQPYLDIIQDVL